MGLLQRLNQGIQAVDDRRNISEMAAQRFDAIGGDQASYWAKSLRANPRAALAMADQHGGFGEIENSLMSARASGQAQQAQAQVGSHLTPIELNALQTGGYGALKQLRESQKVKQEMGQGPAAKDRRIVDGADGFKYYADTGERVLPGVGKTPDRRDTTTDTLGRSVYVDSGEPVIESERGMTMKRGEIVKRFDSRSKDFAPNLVTLRRYEQYKNLPDGAPGDFSRLQILGKMLDDSSVVREGEAELMRVMGASTGKEAWRKIQNVWDVTGIFTPEARGAVDMAIESTYVANARNAINQSESWKAENESLGLSEGERKRATPYESEIKRFRSSLKSFEADIPKESYDAAVEYYTRIGVDPDKITAEMIADIIEKMEGEIASEADRPQERTAPSHFVPIGQPASGPRPVSLEELQAITGRGGN